VIALDARTLSLPLLYLNKHGMNAAQIEAAQAQLRNNATHALVFTMKVPPVGAAVYAAKAQGGTDAAAVGQPRSVQVAEQHVENDRYRPQMGPSGRPMWPLAGTACSS
jgi:hypothetical protein